MVRTTTACRLVLIAAADSVFFVGGRQLSSIASSEAVPGGPVFVVPRRACDKQLRFSAADRQLTGAPIGALRNPADSLTWLTGLEAPIVPLEFKERRAYKKHILGFSEAHRLLLHISDQQELFGRLEETKQLLFGTCTMSQREARVVIRPLRPKLGIHVLQVFFKDASTLLPVEEFTVDWTKPLVTNQVCRIHKATWKGIQVCLKEFKTESLSPEDIQKEISKDRAVQSVLHDNVCRVLGWICEPLCLVTEWLDEHKTLHSAIFPRFKKPCVLTDQERLAALVDTARGLIALHSARESCVDLKPQNIVLCDGKPAKIIDDIVCNNITKCIESTCMSSMNVMLAKLYRAPEGLSSGHKADVFSFGLIALEAWSLEVGNRSLNHSMCPPERSPKLSDTQNEIVQKCCQKDPLARPTMEWVLDRLLSIPKEKVVKRPREEDRKASDSDDEVPDDEPQKKHHAT